MDALQQLYQQLILEHSKKPHGRVASGSLSAGGSGISHQVNPTCGDEITLQVVTDGGVVKEVAWEGQGCSISQAAASVMTDLVVGESVAEAGALNELFHELMRSRGKGLPDDDEEALGDATAFTGVSQYPARIKCALLGWEALKDALGQAAES